jgi:3-dehydroquinate synthase
MNTLTVERKKTGDTEFSYDICWEHGFDRLPEHLKTVCTRPARLCVVSDSRVAELFLEEVRTLLRAAGWDVVSFVFPEGEESKNLSTVRELYRFLIGEKFERKDMLVALGGGVTGDLAGYAAATYLRGIDFIQVPTTLLAQVDSSVGGKTGVDFDCWKNMVGAFHQPRLVYMNMDTLKVLPEEQFSAGMGEVLKTALIRDAELFRWLISQKEAIQRRDPEIMTQVIRECCRIKASVVEEDPMENGIRAILNLGHTIGHAVEKLQDFRLLHGQCVGLGTVGAAWLSLNRGWIREEEYGDIVEAEKAFGLPVSLSGMDPESILQATRSDKKMEGGKIRFILLKGIGNAVIDRSVTDTELMAAIKKLCGE